MYVLLQLLKPLPSSSVDNGKRSTGAGATDRPVNLESGNTAPCKNLPCDKLCNCVQRSS